MGNILALENEKRRKMKIFRNFVDNTYFDSYNWLILSRQFCRNQEKHYA